MDEIDELLTRAFSDPHASIRRAEALLDHANSRDRVRLLRVVGNCHRELRHIEQSLAALTRAVDEATALGDDQLSGLASLSLAASLSYAGELEESVRLGRQATTLLDGDDRVIALSQLAGLLRRAGRHNEALTAFNTASNAAATAEDQTIRGDVWLNRGVLLGFLGRISEAEEDTTNAMQLFRELGWDKRAVDMLHNLGWLAGRRGDIVHALRTFDEAEREYHDLGVSAGSIFPDRCEVLIAAGMFDEAFLLATRSATEFARAGDDVDSAESHLLAARAALLSRRADDALASASHAHSMFAAQDREGWRLDAALMSIRARQTQGDADHALLAESESVVAHVEREQWQPALAAARLTLAELAVALDELDLAAETLSGLDRPALSLEDRFRLDAIIATHARRAGHPGQAIAACERAVAEFTELNPALGGTELRAHAAHHVEGIIEVAIELCLTSGDTAAILKWGERQRSGLFLNPPITPEKNAELERELSLLRAALAEFDQCARDGVGVRDAQARCKRAQEQVRRHARVDASSSPTVSSATATHALLASLETTLVMFVASGSDLYRIAHRPGGESELSRLRMAEGLHVASARLSASITRQLAAISRDENVDHAPVLADASFVDQVLFDGFDDTGPLIISPAPSMPDVPWGVLPSLAAREFAIIPSLALLAGGDRTTDAEPPSVVAVAGPDLNHAADEAVTIAAEYTTSAVLIGANATAAATKERLSNVGVAHIACHGSFSAGNPLFSSLQLADGPLFSHELERIVSPPRVVVLSACDVGQSTRVGNGQLGLSTSLLTSGVVSVVTSCVPIPDSPATIEVMSRLHTQLALGESPAKALRAVRIEAPILAGAFAAFGTD